MTTPAFIVETCLLQATRKAARAVTAHYETAFAALNLTASQFSTLVAVAAAGDRGVGLTQLAAGLGMDRTTLTRVLAPIERRCLVAVSPDEHDGRARILRLGPKGRAILPEAMRLWSQAQTTAAARLNREMTDLQDGLAAMARLG